MYMINVSLLEVRSKPSISSKVTLKRGTMVKVVGPPATYKHNTWIHIQTLDEPIIDGYVLQKYILKM